MENNKICPIPNINDIKKFFSINKQTKILPNLSFSENHYTIEDFFIEKVNKITIKIIKNF